MNLKITKADLDKEGYYKKNSVVVDGSIEIDGDLGTVRFRRGISASQFILAKAGSGIKAGWGIKAGSGIKAGWGIKAGERIEAGWGIKAGEGIEAGLSISCKSLSTPLRIFAGLCSWKIPSKSEMTIIGKIEKGIVAYGVVNEKSHA